MEHYVLFPKINSCFICFWFHCRKEFTSFGTMKWWWVLFLFFKKN